RRRRRVERRERPGISQRNGEGRPAGPQRREELARHRQRGRDRQPRLGQAQQRAGLAADLVGRRRPIEPYAEAHGSFRRQMRGPLLSGPLGSQPALEALVRWTGTGTADAGSPIVVLGPAWLGAALARGGRTLLLVESDARPPALRAFRRARRESRPLDVALA